MSQRLGTASWADPQSVAENYPYKEGTFWLGRSLTEERSPVGFEDDRHICLVSGSRGGKGTTTIINNLCLWPGSLVVVDPKGENATVTASRRGHGSEYCEGMGQAVHVLDPFEAAQVDQTLRSRFNPLDALDPASEEVIDEAGRVADAIVVMQDSKDPFWDESARSMIKGLILHVLTAKEFQGKRNLLTLRKLVQRGDWEAVETLKSLGEHDIPTGHELLWAGLAHNQAFGGLIAGIGVRFRSMALNAPKQFESVLQVAIVNTEFLDSPGMQRCLEASDFKISDLKTSMAGMSVYLCLPQHYMNTHYRWLRMMIALITTEMQTVRGQPATGHRVLMCLDEFAGLKRMEVIENAVAQIAGFGVKLFFVLQTLEQLKGTYKDHWETFLSNSGLKIFFSIEDHFSREYVSKLIGETEVVREARSESISQSESESHTQGESRSTSRSHSQSHSESSSRSTSRSGGTNRSSSHSRGGSFGSSWKPEFFFFWSDKRYSDGSNWSRGHTDGSSRGWSDSHTSGRTGTHGTSTSETYGTTDSHTRGTSRSATDGQSETFHRRPLISPDEIGQYFSRISDKNHPGYPGLALVLISGRQPMAVRRTNYYEDGHLIGCFDPHPDHEFIEDTWETLTIPAPNREVVKYVAPSGNYIYIKWHLAIGGTVQKGAPYLTLVNLDDTFAKRGGTISSELTLRSPVTGLVEQIGKITHGMLRSLPDNQYKSDKSYQDLTAVVRSRESYDTEIERENTLALHEHCRAVRRGLQKAKSELTKRIALRIGIAAVFLLVFLSLDFAWVAWIGAIGIALSGYPDMELVAHWTRFINECPVNDS